MAGLVILFIFAVYLGISVFSTRYVMAWARESGRRPWLWGCITAFAMYNLVFWDMVPTLVMHQYYCRTEAGFWPYKSFEAWDAENPGVVSTLKESLNPRLLHRQAYGKSMKEDTPVDTKRFWYTQRFYVEIVRIPLFGSLVRYEERFFDANDREELARSIDFLRGVDGAIISLGGSPSQIRQSLVLGWGRRGCSYMGDTIRDHFRKYTFQFWKSGRGK